MVMFVWRSRQLLKNYGDGHLIAVADTEDKAREKLRAHFKTWLQEDRDWADEDELEDLRRKFELDLAGLCDTPDSLFIPGSD